MESLRKAAIAYARKGWKIIPLHWPTENGQCSCRDPECTKPGKHPIERGWKEKATTDEETIQRWWKKYQHANIGIVTGADSGLLVLDVDEGGAESIEDYGDFDETLWCCTGNGAHHYFAHPGDTIPNAVKFAPGLDVRADGGLVVAPPSRHASGHTYQWLSDPDRPLEPAPTWLLDALRQHRDTDTGSASSDESTLPPAPFHSPSHGGGGGATSYARAALRQEIERLSSSPEGTRNNDLNRSAFSLGTLVQAGLLDRTEVEAELEHAARALGLAESETRRTITSGIEAGIRKAEASPRKIAPPQAPRPIDQPPPEDLIERFNTYNRSDTGNAECLVAMCSDTLRFCHTRKKWLTWTGSYWTIDEDGAAHRIAVEIARKRYLAASRIDSLEERKAAARWAITSESAGKIEAALKVASFHQPFTSRIDQYDINPWLAATASATLDLSSGHHRSPSPDDYITMALGTEFDPAARCPRWEQFLQEVFDDDQNLIRYVQRAIGYSLTGDTSEQVLFLCYGSGANGKSVFLDILADLFGDYAGSTAFDTFDAANRNTATNDLAALKGKRFVSIIETEEDRRLAEARVKQVTGQDLVDCRFLYGEWFSYKPSYKLWMAMNHLPTIRGTDRGIWRRIRLIPFVQSFEQSPDRRLRDKLQAELPGILNWAIAGLQAWLTNGLGTCPAVSEATERYRRDSDQVGRWIEDCCVVSSDAFVSIRDAYKSYEQWCNYNNERTLSQTMWGRRMGDKDFERFREGYKRFYSGIGLLESDEHDTHDTFYETGPCKKTTRKSSDQRVMRVMKHEPAAPEPAESPTPPVGRDMEAYEEAMKSHAQQLITNALDKAARILSDPTRSPEAARSCAAEVPGAYYQQVLGEIEKMIAVRRVQGGATS